MTKFQFWFVCAMGALIGETASFYLSGHIGYSEDIWILFWIGFTLLMIHFKKIKV